MRAKINVQKTLHFAAKARKDQYKLLARDTSESRNSSLFIVFAFNTGTEMTSNKHRLRGI